MTIGNSTSRAHAVLSDSRLLFYSSLPHERRQLFIAHLDSLDVYSLLNEAWSHGLDTIWVTPGDAFNHIAARDVFDITGIWDIKPSPRSNPQRGAPDLLRGIVARRKMGTWREKRQIVIAYPEYNTYEWGELAEVHNPATCLTAIGYLEQALGLPLHYNAGLVGRDIIAETNQDHSRPHWIAAPTFILNNLTREIARDFTFVSPVIDPSPYLWEQWYVHKWDKNSMYLGAATSAYLGASNPVYLDDLLTNIEALKRWYDGKRPGYWKLRDIRIPENEPYTNLIGDSQEWVTTPLLKLLYARGWHFTIERAYVWPVYHRTLDRFANLVWGARQALKKRELYPDENAARIAAYSVKRIATASVGILANEDVFKYAPGWFRPDWRATIVEEAKAKMIYKLAQIERETGTRPLAVQVDAVYYLSRVSNPALAYPLFDRPGELGGWKHEATAMLTPALLEHLKTGVKPRGVARAVELHVGVL